MKPLSALKLNKLWWEKMVKEECGFTQPWLNLDPVVVKKVANGLIKKVPQPLNTIFPTSILKNIKGKSVLCLAGGGGQQSAVFSLLDAHVSVLDISKGQLENDKKAAKHYGYKVRTVQGDMSDLKVFENNTFDMVYQSPSMGYVPNVKKVYREVARVLKPGGIYVADAQNPLAQYIEETSWDGKGYRITVPYAVKEKQRSDNEKVIEYRHYLSDIFNNLVDCGFSIEHIEESPPDLYQRNNPKPGTWSHLLLYAPGIFVILAKKR